MEGSARLCNMSVIEGVGDEVLQFFAFIFIILLVITAWRSTKVREANLVWVNLLTRWLILRLYEEVLRRRLANRNISRAELRGITTESSRDSSVLNDSREGESSTSSAGSTASVQGRDAEFPKETINDDAMNALGSSRSPNEKNRINIKLKFANSSVKITDAYLNEKLGEFKGRNFNTELSQGNTVVLIFNGKMLKSDEETLRGCGLFGDCVVHCLVREPPAAPPPRSSRNREGSLATVVLSSVGVVLLGVIWYSRYRYAALFSLPATACLVAMTAIYLAFLVSTYLPEEVNLLPVQR